MGPQGTCCGTLSATTATTPTVTVSLGLEAARCSKRFYTSTVTGIVFFYVPVSWLCCPEQSCAAGAGFSHSLRCRCCGSKPPPEPSSLHPAPSVYYWGGRACPSPYSACCCCCREKRCCQSLRPGRTPLASLQLHLKAVGHVDLGASVEGWQGRPALSGR